jgi:PAS domain S-box
MKTSKLGKNLDGQEFLRSYLESEDRLAILERAVKSARNGICITDSRLPGNPIIYANEAFVNLTGYSLDEILGRNCRFLQGADHDQLELETVRAAISEGRECICVLRNYKKDGTLFWNELSIAPVRDANGQIVNFVGVQNDVTARREAERRVSEFYSMISHELRTPLTSIRASLGIIDDGDAGHIPSAALRLIQIAKQNSERLLKLVDDILDLKKMEAGKLKLEFTMMDADAIVTEVITGLYQLVEEAGLKLEKKVTTKKMICADAARVTQVLINLVANAVKFSPKSSTVLIQVEDFERGLRFAVIDNGPGIAPQDLDKLFSKFQQLDSSDTRPHAGTGLGLAISKTIVELHGGTIGVDSEEGKGSTFWFTLPPVPQSDGE